MVAPEVVGTATTFASATSGATVVLDRPGGVQDGDMLVAVLRTPGSTSPTDFTLSGWTRRGYTFIPNDAAGRVTGIFTHPVTSAASEPASYTFTKSVADARRVGAMFIVRGVDLTDPVLGQSTGWNASGSPTIVLNPFAVASADPALFLYAWATEIVSPNATEPTATPGTAIALVPSSAGTGSIRTTVWVGSEVLASTSSGSKSLTWSSAAAQAATGVVLRGLNVVSRAGDGSVSVVGSATRALAVAVVASGGVSVTGAASAAVTVSRAADGAVSVSGAAAVAVAVSRAADGVVAVVGAAVAVVGVAVAAPGAVTVGAVASVALVVAVDAVGAVTVVGAAVVKGPPFPDVLTLAGGVDQYTLDGSVEVLTLEAR
ncbi:hypothetical protein [Microbacterium sp. p3-SID131]|uniref:hypothetical protein n=1 Tax=Microbacterium sp. p3-SID131 TaxID=2916215 RepID=UPI0021A29593|nr:hypothetical protein [Microbacterium sp. p3-SID131]MCT1363983.1 hypothetical protein [Microbacterium sp. p3-SID131]